MRLAARLLGSGAIGGAMSMLFLRKILAAALLSMLLASPAQAAWLRGESDHFIVYSEASEGDLRRQLAVLEDYHALLRTLSGVEEEAAPVKLPIYIVRNHDQLRRVRPVGREVGGFYTASPMGMAAFVNTGAGGDWVGANEVLFHEYAHHFMMQYQGAGYPAWYVEGFAEYMATARFGERNVEFGRPAATRAVWLANRSEWLPLEQIMFQRGGEGRSRADGARFYAQSWLLTHYLLSDAERLGRLRNYLRGLGRGEAPPAAFQASFGVTPAQLQRELASYAFGRMHYLRMDRASVAQTPRIAIAALPRSAGDLLLLQAAMRIGAREPEALVAEIRRLAARHDDAFARRVLAEAEALHGDPAAAGPLLAALLAESPNDVDLLYLRGMIHIQAAKQAEAEARASQFQRARVWLSRAHRANDRHFQTLYRYAQTFSDEPGFLSENNLNVMLLAHQLAPQVADIRMTAVQMLLMRRDYELAEALLRPLASTAHDGPLAAAAREMLERARARNNAGIGVRFEETIEPEGESAEPAGED